MTPEPNIGSPLFYGVFFIAVLIMIGIDMLSLKKNRRTQSQHQRSPALVSHLDCRILRLRRLAVLGNQQQPRLWPQYRQNQSNGIFHRLRFGKIAGRR